MKFAFLLLCILFISSSASAEIEIGAPVPDFILNSTEGNPFQLSTHAGDPVVLIFWCATCPYTKAYEMRMKNLFDAFALKGVHFFGIAACPGETPKSIRGAAARREVPFPILLDPDLQAAKMLGAEKTPEIFMVARDGTLAYHGAVDDESFFKGQPTRHYVAEILSAMLSGEKLPYRKTKIRGRKIWRKS